MAKLSIRIDFGEHARLGPGKVRLIELIGEHGSISAAGRALGMSYRRAWLLVSELNAMFREPVITTQPGGRSGGGAALTPFGAEVVARYRALERHAAEAGAAELAFLESGIGDL